MSIVHSQPRHARHLHPVPLGKQVPVHEGISDCWPETATELADENIRACAAKNAVGRVLGEALGAVIYSVGLVIALMVFLEMIRNP